MFSKLQSAGLKLKNKYFIDIKSRFKNRNFFKSCQNSFKTNPSENKPQFRIPTLISNFFNRFYLLDTRANFSLLPYALLSIITTSSWLWFKFKKNGDDFMNNHFTCTIRNLEQGRYYTLFTSAFGGHGDTFNSGVIEMTTIVMFAGILSRSFGFFGFFGLYFSGHLLSTSILLYKNYNDRKIILDYKENQSNPEEPNKISVNRERRTQILALERKYHQETNEEKLKEIEILQRSLLRMPIDSFLSYATNYYETKPSFFIGGTTSILTTSFLLYPFSLIPVPYFAIPSILVIPFQLYVNLIDNKDFKQSEYMFGLVASSIPSLLFSIIFRKTKIKYMPLEIFSKIHIPKWVPRHNQTKDSSVPVSVDKTYNSNVLKDMNIKTKKTSEDQIELMKKRNEKYLKQIKNKHKS